VQGVASLPCHPGQATGERLIPAPAVRSQDVADFVGKLAHLGLHLGGDPIDDLVQPDPPVGLVEPVDPYMQRVFRVIDFVQEFLAAAMRFFFNAARSVVPLSCSQSSTIATTTA